MTSPAHSSSTSHLSPAQQQLLERILLEERDRIRRILARRRRLRATDVEDEAGVNRAPNHLAELGSETMQQTLDGALATRETATLAQIDAALRRLYRRPDRFGVDDVTGEPIPFERLEVIPWARHAVPLG